MTRMLSRPTRRVHCLLVIMLTAVVLAGAPPASAGPVMGAVNPQSLQPETGTTVLDWTTFPDGSPIPNETEITDQFAAWGVTFQSPPGPPRVLTALGGILISGGPTSFFGDISMSFLDTGRGLPTSITVEIIGSGLNIGARLEGFATDGSSLGVVTHTYSGNAGQLSAFTLEAPTGTKIASALFNGALNPSAAASIGTLILRWPSALVGNAEIQPNVDANPAGTAEAFRYTAAGTGAAGQLSVYLHSASTATKVIVGLYTNTSAGNPGALLTSGTITDPQAGAWNAVTVPATAVTSGTDYWLAVLAPHKAGTVKFRDLRDGTGGPTQTSAQTSLNALPNTWKPGTRYANSPASLFAAP